MSSPKTPVTHNGESLQTAFSRLPCLGETPLDISAGAATTSASIGAHAVYVFLSVHCHLRLSTAGSAATTAYPPLPAGAYVLPCNPDDRLSAVMMSGQSGGQVWVHPVWEN
jgi:hypothetical protein